MKGTQKINMKPNTRGSQAKHKTAATGTKPAGKPKSAKATQIKPARTTPATPKQEKIVQVHQEQPHLNISEIAAVVETSHSYVVETLQRYGLRHKHLKDYQAARAETWDMVSLAMLGSLTTDDIKKIPGAARIMAAGLAYDKMRIERGLPDGSSKPMVQINIVAPGGNVIPNPSITYKAQPIDTITHDSSSVVDIPPNISPNVHSDSLAGVSDEG